MKVFVGLLLIVTVALVASCSLRKDVGEDMDNEKNLFYRLMLRGVWVLKAKTFVFFADEKKTDTRHGNCIFFRRLKTENVRI